jgi:hypothetical protein
MWATVTSVRVLYNLSACGTLRITASLPGWRQKRNVSLKSVRDVSRRERAFPVGGKIRGVGDREKNYLTLSITLLSVRHPHPKGVLTSFFDTSL